MKTFPPHKQCCANAQHVKIPKSAKIYKVMKSKPPATDQGTFVAFAARKVSREPIILPGHTPYEDLAITLTTPHATKNWSGQHRTTAGVGRKKRARPPPDALERISHEG